MKARREWFIHARRNASLHHLSFLMAGFSGNGWAPTIEFSIPDVIVAGYPDKGGFVFLDRTELHEGGKRLRSIQESVDANSNFIRDFRKRTNELFGALFFACERIDAENLTLLSLAELGNLYTIYIDAMLAGPLITVQVYGIEAMIDPAYVLISSLHARLAARGAADELEDYKQIFLTNDGETVPFTERKDFYRVCAYLDRPEVLDLFKKAPEEIERDLIAHPEIETLIQKHIDKYYWVNTEYLGGGWTKVKWLTLFKEALLSEERPAQELARLLASTQESARRKEDALKELEMPAEATHAISALGEFLAQRDWTKGYVARSLLSYHRLLREIAARLGISFEDVLLHSYLELDQALRSQRPLDPEELRIRREEGYVFSVHEGGLDLRPGSAERSRTLTEEGIEDPLQKMEPEREVRGLCASRGSARGIARVIDEASKIPEFKDGEILVTYMTTIEFTPLFRKAVAVVTDEGGMSCHAAIVSREFKLPCIVGTKVATRTISTGDLIEVDATAGVVRVLAKTDT